ncbi:sigma-70 family RNA polymerase sigma factor [Streptomyces sp. NRRL S-350]|uniref:sigma-70 family RNA polymerase sigma factor n=1 Tax=Streptomyces sp. NRRL S-350 TaxID=1463902 RepID=UPI0004C2ADD9|nr:sigma-70 family RNA polymerase sigma factor [Streptomyces sp. NRRL S-350]
MTMTYPGTTPQETGQHPDEELFRLLKDADFCGPRFELFREDTWLYAHDVLCGWMYTGEVGAQCGVELWPMELQMLNRSQELREELAVQTVMSVASWWFEEEDTGLRSWEPERGAGLRTFFIRPCKLAFKNAARAWRRDRERQLGGDLNRLTDLRANSGSAEEAVLLRDVLRQVMEIANPVQQSICWHIYSSDLTYQDIGKKLGGMTARAVEGQMRRLRKEVAAKVETGTLNVPTRFAARPGRSAKDC